jgi:hypothetical protein
MASGADRHESRFGEATQPLGIGEAQLGPTLPWTTAVMSAFGQVVIRPRSVQCPLASKADIRHSAIGGEGCAAQAGNCIQSFRLR